MGVTVDMQQLGGIESFLAETPDVARRAMSIALNDVVGGPGLATMRRAISSEIAFEKSYLNDDRLGVTQRASPSRLEVKVTGRHRPTSLARFVTRGVVGGKGGVAVRVKTGSGARSMKNAFLVRLRAGGGISDDNFNVGLAVRLKPGQTLNKTHKIVSYLAPNTPLLYGPSIEQVLRVSVAADVVPKVAEDVAVEFFRQFTRLSNV